MQTQLTVRASMKRKRACRHGKKRVPQSVSPAQGEALKLLISRQTEIKSVLAGIENEVRPCSSSAVRAPHSVHVPAALRDQLLRKVAAHSGHVKAPCIAFRQKLPRVPVRSDMRAHAEPSSWLSVQARHAKRGTDAISFSRSWNSAPSPSTMLQWQALQRRSATSELLEADEERVDFLETNIAFREHPSTTAETHLRRDSSPNATKLLNDNEWPLSAVCVGDGSVSCNGKNYLRKGVFYTAGQARGSHEQFHPEDRTWMTLESVGFEEIRLPTYWVSIPKRVRVPAPPFVVPASLADKRYPRRSLMKRREYVACELLDFCDQHPGLAVVVTSIDFRQSNPALRDQLQTKLPVTIGRQLNCLTASVLNGLASLLGVKPDDSLVEHVRANLTRCQSLKNIDQPLAKLRLGVRSMKNRAAQMRSIARIDRMKWLSSLSSGIWIVHIRYGTALDHAVCVDAERKLIFDNAEEFPFPLTELNLQHCGGSEYPNCYIESIRELVRTNK